MSGKASNNDKADKNDRKPFTMSNPFNRKNKSATSSEDGASAITKSANKKSRGEMTSNIEKDFNEDNLRSSTPTDNTDSKNENKETLDEKSADDVDEDNDCCSSTSDEEEDYRALAGKITGKFTQVRSTSGAGRKKGGKGGKKKGGKTSNKQKATEKISSPESSLESVVEGAVQRALTHVMPTIVTEISNNVVSQITKKIETLQTEVKVLKEEVKRSRILNAIAEDRAEQYSRRENIVIHGLEEIESETTAQLLDKTVEIGQLIDVEIPKASIGAVHRLGKKGQGQRPRAVVVRTNRLMKQSIMQNKQQLKTKNKNIIMYDDLTAPRRKLYKFCKDHKKVAFCHVRDGAIITKLQDGAFRKIESADDSFHLGEDEIDYTQFYNFQDLS